MNEGVEVEKSRMGLTNHVVNYTLTRNIGTLLDIEPMIIMLKLDQSCLVQRRSFLEKKKEEKKRVSFCMSVALVAYYSLNVFKGQCQLWNQSGLPCHVWIVLSLVMPGTGFRWHVSEFDLKSFSATQ